MITHANLGGKEFERIYVEHRQRLFAFLVYRTSDRALAEDLLGDVFERAFHARTRFDPRRGSEISWLYTIAVNRLHDHYRRAQVERASLRRIVAAKTGGVEPPQEAVADRDQVMQALDVLSPPDREIITLRFGADLTMPQIAHLTEQPLGVVTGRLYRALRRLGTVLGPEADGLRGRLSHEAELTFTN